MKRNWDIMLSELAYMLEAHSFECEMFFDLEEWSVYPCSNYMGEDDCFYPIEGHHVIQVFPIESRLSFSIMENFLDTLPHDEPLLPQLTHALNKRHPFRHFKAIVHQSPLRPAWLAFHEERMKEHAKQWLKDNEISIDDHGNLTSPKAWPFNRKEYFEDYDQSLFFNNEPDET